MSMTEEEKLAQALSHVRRYELYRLLRAWGALVIAVGSGFFFTSWSVFLRLYALLRDLLFGNLTDEQEMLLFTFVLNVQVIILGIVVTIVASIMIATYLSVTKLSVKNQELATRRMRRLGVSLLVLFGFTFANYTLEGFGLWLASWNLWFVQFCSILFMTPLAMGFLMSIAVLRIFVPWYVPPALGVLLAYRLLRAEIGDYDFGEVRDLVFLLLILSVIEFSWRIIFLQIINPLYAVLPPSTYAFFLTWFYDSYLLLDFLLAVSYGVSGLQSWRRARQVLKGRLGNQ